MKANTENTTPMKRKHSVAIPIEFNSKASNPVSKTTVDFHNPNVTIKLEEMLILAEDLCLKSLKGQ